MAKAKNKTVANEASVETFLESIEDEKKKADAWEILRIMQEISREAPVMWGTSIVGFGSYHYTYESGREGDMAVIGFSPRKQSLTLYIMNGFDRYEELMSQLGKYKTGKSCLYIKRLTDVDLEVLKTLIKESVDYMNKKYNS